MERIRTELAVWLPDPLTVATCMLKSFITEWLDWPDKGSTGETSSVDIDRESLVRRVLPSSQFLLIISKTGERWRYEGCRRRGRTCEGAEGTNQICP